MTTWVHQFNCGLYGPEKSNKEQSSFLTHHVRVLQLYNAERLVEQRDAILAITVVINESEKPTTVHLPPLHDLGPEIFVLAAVIDDRSV